MAFLRYAVELTGTAPLLSSNNCTIDQLGAPAEILNWYYKIPAKKREPRVERAMRNLHWLFSGYWNNEGAVTHPSETDGFDVFEGYSEPILPAANLQRCLRDAATAWKLGKDVSRSTIVENDAVISYDGPREARAMLQDGRYYSCRPNGRGNMAIRMILPSWVVRFNVLINDEIMGDRDFAKILDRAGVAEGLGAWRPGSPKGGRFGRFQVTELTPVEIGEEN
jgi:hypothetical protein